MLFSENVCSCSLRCSIHGAGVVDVLRLVVYLWRLQCSCGLLCLCGLCVRAGEVFVLCAVFNLFAAVLLATVFELSLYSSFALDSSHRKVALRLYMPPRAETRLTVYRAIRSGL